MNPYEITEKVEGEKYTVNIAFAPRPTSVSRRLASVNAQSFEHGLIDLTKKHFHQFASEHYPNNNFYNSFKNGLNFSSDNKDCIEKIAKILIDIRGSLNEIYNKEININDIVSVTTFYKLLEPCLSSAILNETLSATLPTSISNKKRNKI